MNRSPRTPPPGVVGALVAAIGLGIACWYGWLWFQVPPWSERDIAASVELNLALDLSRLPPDSVPAEARDRLRVQIRREVEAQIARELEEPRGYTLAGLLMAAFGFAQMFIRMRLARR